jgi:tryptophan-rich sensory protein
MLPLLPWVSFATALNAKILTMNRRSGGGGEGKRE